MKKALFALVATTLLAGSAYATPALSNVTTGATVTLVGNDFGNSQNWGASGTPAAASSIVDGASYAVGHQWNIGTVYWTSYNAGDSIQIDLKKTATVSSIFLQADNNDDYLIQYRGADKLWHDLTTVSPPDAWGLGNVSQALPSSVTTDAFKIVGINGDHFYSVSEFSATGTIAAVPEPSTYAMLGLGLGLLGWTARRRAAK
ncbi:MAG: PEP-CTERM sorting domain-containing protein [Burkholderiaceae bacterium]|nr:PEP-CTERM sorting domain-containing protein [Burkholderiaceae bacterium]